MDRDSTHNVCTLRITSGADTCFKNGGSETDGGVRERWEKPGASPDGAYMRVRPDGRQLTIRRHRQAPEDDRNDEGERDGSEDDTGSSSEEDSSPEASKRGDITGFSEASRRRLRGKVHSVERDAINLFVSLTFHEWWPTPEEAKECLDRFRKRLDEVFPEWSGIWKMEPQDRGMPHFHMLIFGPEWIPVQWLSALWHEVTSDVSDYHRKSGVDIEHIRSDGKLQSYLSKYMCTEYAHWPMGRMCDNGCPEAVAEKWAKPGRFWGVHWRERIPWARWATWGVHIPNHVATRMIVDLLTEWEIDTGGAIPPSLTINTRGDPTKRLDRLMEKYGLMEARNSR